MTGRRINDLDRFPPFPLSTLRNLWKQYPDENLHRLILEVLRLRRDLRDVDGLCARMATAVNEDSCGAIPQLTELQAVVERNRALRNRVEY